METGSRKDRSTSSGAIATFAAILVVDVTITWKPALTTKYTYIVNAKLSWASLNIRENIQFVCFFVQFTEIIFVDHQTGSKIYFKRRTSQSITAAISYGKAAGTYGLWDGVEANNAYSYQLLICDTLYFSGFFVSGYTSACYKQCSDWCGDGVSPYFRTAHTNAIFSGVAFNSNGHNPLNNRLISVGLR